jgi:hypothetical protein
LADFCKDVEKSKDDRTAKSLDRPGLRFHGISREAEDLRMSRSRKIHFVSVVSSSGSEPSGSDVSSP